MRPSLDIRARTCTRYAPERAIRPTTGIEGQADIDVSGHQRSRRFSAPGFKQDGYDYRALSIVPRPTVTMPCVNAACVQHPQFDRSSETLRHAGVTVLYGEGGFGPNQPGERRPEGYPWRLALDAVGSFLRGAARCLSVPWEAWVLPRAPFRRWGACRGWRSSSCGRGACFLVWP